LDEYEDTGYFQPTPASKEEREAYWKTGIGLQAVDGIMPSEYLYRLAEQNIDGKIDNAGVENALAEYYEKKSDIDFDERQRIADYSSNRIVQVLEKRSFSLSVASLRSIHRFLFSGTGVDSPGEFKKVDLIKSESILYGDTVEYGSASDVEEDLERLLHRELRFTYDDTSDEYAVRHIAELTSELWQIHPFAEGNTRTTAVFVQGYLRKNGYKIGNNPFAENSLYYRNALVRANYTNRAYGVERTFEYIVKFYENLLLGTDHDLRNRDLYVHELSDGFL
jgi:fido (protein-threonine AMPylation protein)